MKKIILASSLAFVLSTVNTVEAATQEANNIDHASHVSNSKELKASTRNEIIGFGSGATAGVLLGGPVGGIIGGIFGIFMANDINQDAELTQQSFDLDNMQKTLSMQSKEYRQLQEQYAYLEQSQMIQLASMDTKVATEWMQDLPRLESNIQFKTASFLVEESFKSQLQSLAGLLKQYPKLSVHVNGYADARGDSQYNRILSEQRAQSVKDFLIQQRVEPKQIIAQGQGELTLAHANPESQTEDQITNTHIEDLFFDRRATLTLLTGQKEMTAAN